MKIILASASPRRRELLTQIGLEFEVFTSSAEEVITKKVPEEIVLELATQKATVVAKAYEKRQQEIGAGKACDQEQKATVAQKEKMPTLATETEAQQEKIVFLGADTIVVNNGKILGKPKDAADAFSMLSSLSDHTHQVYTGVCVLYGWLDDFYVSADRLSCHCFFEKTDVSCAALTEAEILSYIDTKDPFDKAGSYGIQGMFAKHIKGISGDYNNVVGLPVARVYHELKQLGLL